MSIQIDVSGGNSVTIDGQSIPQTVEVSSSSSQNPLPVAGETGQLLAKNSPNNFDVVWVDVPYSDMPSLTLTFEDALV